MTNKKYYTFEQVLEELPSKQRVYRNREYRAFLFRGLWRSAAAVYDELIRWKSYTSDRRRVYRADAVNLLGSKCIKCGFNDSRTLQIDHINGGGNQERRERFSNSGPKFYRHVIEMNGIGYQLLCANCNWIKRVENKEQAHPRTTYLFLDSTGG